MMKAITPANTWHSPINVYWHLQRLTNKVGEEAIEKNREYQPMREARVGAVVALVMLHRLGKPTYLQLYKPDPPDVILMQQRNGTRDITQLEITTYIGKPRETFFEQLIRTKVPPGIHKYSENYILVVNVGIGMKIDYKPMRDYLNTNKTPFPVWVVQQIQAKPDTIAKVTILNPEIYEMEINVGEAAAIFQQLKLAHVVHSKRVANPKLVKAVLVGEDRDAPWETIGK